MSKEMNSQLLTMIGIFTALAFLVFGGINSLDNVFSEGVPVLKLMVVGSVWGLCILNLVFVFLFCVGKMTKLKFSSTDDETASIFQKYPIVWWSNLILTSIMILCSWLYYLTKENVHTWFGKIFHGNPLWPTVIGTVIILGVICVLGYILIRETKYPTNNHK